FFGFALSLNAQGISVHYDAVTPERVQGGQRRSLTFMTWTVDDIADIDRMLDAGVDSICSNLPDVVRTVLDARAP
ncbi:MAG TPA: glycerophosphodiester phosphodiesterase family protein, partial [Dehalococcoidia bacterium]